MTTEETTGYPIPPDHCDKHEAYHKFCSLCGTAKRNHDAAVEGREAAASESTAESDGDDEKDDEKKPARRRSPR